VPDRILQLAKRSGSPVLLSVFLVASAALHAIVLLAVPDAHLERLPPHLTVMEVVLVQIDPARPEPVMPSRTEALAINPSGKSARVASAQPAARPTTQQPRQTMLTLPDIPPPESVIAPAEMAARVPVRPEPAPQAASIAPPTLPSFSASYLRNPAPRYPLAARRAGEQGTVTLKVLVARDGLPRRIELEETSGSTHLDTAALEAVRQWRFVPARRGTVPIESWVLVPVVFRLENPS